MVNRSPQVALVGLEVGIKLGARVGFGVGAGQGCAEGRAEGLLVGLAVGCTAVAFCAGEGLSLCTRDAVKLGGICGPDSALTGDCNLDDLPWLMDNVTTNMTYSLARTVRL